MGFPAGAGRPAGDRPGHGGARQLRPRGLGSEPAGASRGGARRGAHPGRPHRGRLRETLARERRRPGRPGRVRPHQWPPWRARRRRCVLNPGSAGPRRFGRPRTIARLEIRMPAADGPESTACHRGDRRGRGVTLDPRRRSPRWRTGWASSCRPYSAALRRACLQALGHVAGQFAQPVGVAAHLVVVPAEHLDVRQGDPVRRTPG